eukprot:TRINITY_DN482_c0_g2_i1.p1 TRINITY_DN482_c0_g2~~TRINITY_DN482_c0_g2_i1.p1  ORF type:complete len:379 (-),score=49.20 TRINITY_DN482_c0_g2_i1:524-1660(-)
MALASNLRVLGLVLAISSLVYLFYFIQVATLSPYEVDTNGVGYSSGHVGGDASSDADSGATTGNSGDASGDPDGDSTGGSIGEGSGDWDEEYTNFRAAMDEINFFSEVKTAPSHKNRTLPEFCYSPNATLNLLVFVSYDGMYNKIIQHINQYPDGLRRAHHNYNVEVWGPGFEGFDEKILLAQNVERRFGRKDYFHIIYVLYALDRTKDDVKSIGDNSMVFRLTAEMRRRKETLFKAVGHVIIGVYAQEVPMWAEELIPKGVNIVSIPWLFNKDMINGDVEAPRPVDVTFMATKGGKFYPYREVLYQASEILRKKGYNVTNTQVDKGGKANWQSSTNGREYYNEYLEVLFYYLHVRCVTHACVYAFGLSSFFVSSGLT